LRFISTLTNVKRFDTETAGFRAADLSVLKEKGFNIPLSFVVLGTAHEEFFLENGLAAKVQRVPAEKKNEEEAYQDILALFAKSKHPKDFLAELKEAYESLTIEPGSSANSLIQEFDYPFVTVVRSPGYILGTEDEEGMLDNVKGLDQLAMSIKLVWATLYSPTSMRYRKNAGVSEKFGTGVVVQKMKNTKVSALAYSTTEFNQYMLRVKSFKGLHDYADPILGKDIHEVDLNTLLIRNSKVNVQEHEMTRDVESDELVKRPLLGAASGQKLNDKLVCECARMAKRAKSFIGKNVKLYLAVQDDVISVLQANRITAEPKKDAAALELLKNSGQHHGSEEKGLNYDATADLIKNKESKLKMPSLLTLEDAKQEAMQEMSHKLFSLKGYFNNAATDSKEFDVQAGEKNSGAAKTQASSSASSRISPASESKEEFEEPGDLQKENELLDEVLQIKEITERMESLASTGNREAYEQEAKKLRELLGRVRQK
jgi:hypothetical protein